MWEKAVVQEVMASSHTNNIVLRDHLPNMLDNIADLLIEYDGFPEAVSADNLVKIVGNSSDHGRHRAASKMYTVDQVVREYIIFHRTITRVLRAQQVYSADVADALKQMLETAILQSVTAFTGSIQDMQEKLVGSLAHDLRNPISAAHGLLGLMSYRKNEETFEKLRQMALRSLDKSLKLTEGLLDAITARAGEGMVLSFSQSDISKEIHTVHEEACHIYSQEVKLVCEASSITGVFDGTAVRRLLENLLTNAIKYGDTNRPVTIRVEDKPEVVEISVHNYGNPIPPEKQSSIFAFLSRGVAKQDSELPSWGIGLTFVRVIAHAHNGHVTVRSTSEEGTRFTVRLSKRNKPGKIRTRLLMGDPG